MSLICPLCRQPLQQVERSWRCESRHQFDQAKEGYINLLPVQHKGSREPGDSADMMQARREFLQAGYYQPLRDSVVTLLQQSVPTATALLDIGCGEGYYTAALSQPGVSVYGLDIAKNAIRLAAKRYPAIQFCVASSQRLPFSDASLDAVVRIYAPCNEAELARVIRPGGILLTVTPGAHHLQQLKALIYRDVQLHAAEEKCYAGFSEETQQMLEYGMSLSGEAAATLLQMTPFAWRAKPSVWGELQASNPFTCDADFRLTVWRRQ